MRVLKFILWCLCSVAGLVGGVTAIMALGYLADEHEVGIGFVLLLFLTLPSALVLIASLVGLGVLKARERAISTLVAAPSGRCKLGRILVVVGFGLAILATLPNLFSLTSSSVLSSSEWLLPVAFFGSAVQATPGLLIAMVGYWLQRGRPEPVQTV